MIHVGTLAQARLTRQSFKMDGALLSHKSVIIGGAAGDTQHPNAFLIEQEPGRLLPAHFHGWGQFQVVVAGGGKLGTHELRPLTVHYAGQRSPYGPILPGDQGLWYLTLRPRTESGVFFMPESRGYRDPAKIPRFDCVSEFHQTAGTHNATVNDLRIEQIMPEKTRGLGAWLMRIPAGSAAQAPALPGGAGRYHVVVGGSLQHPSEPLDWLSMIWSDADEAPLALQAGPGGAEVLVLQFPGDACLHPHPDPERTTLTSLVSRQSAAS